MKSVIYALIGLVMYAITNTIIDVRLKQYSTPSLLVGWYLVLLPLALGLYLYQRFAGRPTALPTVGGNAITITILAVLLPVVVALIKFVWVKEVPTPYHLAAFACALLAIVFIAVGNAKKPIEIPTQTITLHE
jgi:drug/metabolite transporter (DMT)-like permease